MSRLIKLLEMGLDMTRAEIGQVKFRSSTISDPHIRMLVNEVAKRTGIPTAALDAELSEEIKKIDYTIDIDLNTIKKNDDNDI